MAAPEAGSNMRVSAADVCYVTNNVKLIRDVRLDLAPGEFVAIVGPNGAGKSTLLRLLAGDLRPSHGAITYDTVDVSSLRVRELATSRAFLEQRQAEDITFTVGQVVEMGRYPYRNDDSIGPDEDRRAVIGALEALDLVAIKHRSVASLSGGERQRTAIARTLAQEAPLVLLDEPTTALDIGHQEMAFGIMRSLGTRGRTVVAALHDLNMATAFDQVVLLHRGGVAACGTAEDVLNAKRLTEVYQYPIEVVQHPLRPGLLVLPSTDRSAHS
jgi:iron complex transport system ATP-binding protein